jgi:hypothetical protein
MGPFSQRRADLDRVGTHSPDRRSLPVSGNTRYGFGLRRAGSPAGSRRSTCSRGPPTARGGCLPSRTCHGALRSIRCRGHGRALDGVRAMLPGVGKLGSCNVAQGRHVRRGVRRGSVSAGAGPGRRRPALDVHGLVAAREAASQDGTTCPRGCRRLRSASVPPRGGPRDRSRDVAGSGALAVVTGVGTRAVGDHRAWVAAVAADQQGALGGAGVRRARGAAGTIAYTSVAAGSSCTGFRRVDTVAATCGLSCPYGSRPTAGCVAPYAAARPKLLSLGSSSILRFRPLQDRA